MTVAKMKREMRRLGLSQGDVATMLGITQPTVSNILSSEHELTERNAEAFVRGVARMEAVGAVNVQAPNEKVNCLQLNARLDPAAFVAHLDTCAPCLASAFLSRISS
jgi:predicted transcriptional regulator